MDAGEPRETTYEERATWGTCPVCGAPHGEWCYPEVGLHLGRKMSGGEMGRGDGAHLGRLQNAPRRVKLVPA